MTENLYLAHHGVKGMKWGVRRTPEQLGRVESFRAQRKLNSLDRKRAVEEGRINKYSGKAVRLSGKYYDRQRRKLGYVNVNDHPDIAYTKRQGAKVQKALDRNSVHVQKQQRIVEEQKRLVDDILERHGSVKTKDVWRSTTSRGEKAARAVFSVGLVVASAGRVKPSTGGGYSVRGRKYKVTR